MVFLFNLRFGLQQTRGCRTSVWEVGVYGNLDSCTERTVVPKMVIKVVVVKSRAETVLNISNFENRKRSEDCG